VEAGAGERPTRAVMVSRRSRASAVNQPAVSQVRESETASEMNGSPGVRRKPKRPQKAEGTRTEPPVSVPMASGTMPAATAAAEPLLEPPVVRPGRRGCSQSP